MSFIYPVPVEGKNAEDHITRLAAGIPVQKNVGSSVFVAMHEYFFFWLGLFLCTNYYSSLRLCYNFFRYSTVRLNVRVFFFYFTHFRLGYLLSSET